MSVVILPSSFALSSHNAPGRNIYENELNTAQRISFGRVSKLKGTEPSSATSFAGFTRRHCRGGTRRSQAPRTNGDRAVPRRGVTCVDPTTRLWPAAQGGRVERGRQSLETEKKADVGIAGIREEGRWRDCWYR